ncbi:hypothetical protein BN977_02548 [Mycolicibacterium cosmeticum]|uniref:Uncharacterized protein n=1 Tax=Mycolicibacterium cosmeticum TaxID=258533 RepID=W9AYS5_MYCCO|nr:hypothetical protein BN977_02548 [Mycolicibacterium cosmeticum]
MGPALLAQASATKCDVFVKIAIVSARRRIHMALSVRPPRAPAPRRRAPPARAGRLARSRTEASPGLPRPRRHTSAGVARPRGPTPTPPGAESGHRPVRRQVSAASHLILKMTLAQPVSPYRRSAGEPAGKAVRQPVSAAPGGRRRSAVHTVGRTPRSRRRWWASPPGAAGRVLRPSVRPTPRHTHGSRRPAIPGRRSPSDDSPSSPRRCTGRRYRRRPWRGQPPCALLEIG